MIGGRGGGGLLTQENLHLFLRGLILKGTLLWKGSFFVF